MPLRDIDMSTQETDPPLPRKPEGISEIRRLRREALEHLDAEEHPAPSVVYGGPAPVYGGPGLGGRITRRWTLRRILLLIAAILAGLGATLFGVKRFAAPVYGGPPIPPQPKPDGSDEKHTNPVYGGPVSPGPGEQLRPMPKPSPKPHRHTPTPNPNPVAAPPAPAPHVVVRPAAAVYGGPAPRPVPTPSNPATPPPDPQ